MLNALILAAGTSTRTYPLTITRPKPLLPIGNKSILEYNMEALQGFVSEVFIVIGYKAEMIRDRIGNSYKKIKINYIEQKDLRGTGSACLSAKNLINARFILLMGDNIYCSEDIGNCLKHEYSVLTTKVKDPQNFGIFKVHNNKVKDLIEKPQLFVSDQANCALYVLDEKIFEYLEKISISQRGEYELTDAIRKFAFDNDLIAVDSRLWIPIGYPWDLLEAKEILCNKNIIGKDCMINGKIINSSIGDNCRIEGNVKNSIIMSNTKIRGDMEYSVVGENVSFNGKALAGENVISLIKKIPVKVGKLGAIIGDNVKAEGVEIQPGVKVWPNKDIKGKIAEDVQ